MGKEAEGRAEPVQIKLRPRGVGIGFSDDEQNEEASEEEEKRIVKKKEKKSVVSMAAPKQLSSARDHPVQEAVEFDIVALERISMKTEIIDMTKPLQSSGPKKH